MNGRFFVCPYLLSDTTYLCPDKKINIMLDCLETSARIIAVFPVPAGHFTYAVPFNVAGQHTLAATSVSRLGTSFANVAELIAAVTSLRGFIVDGAAYNNTPANSITVEDGIAAKSTGRTAIGGHSFSTKVSLRTQEPNENLSPWMDSLADAPYFDLYLLDEDNTLFFVRGSRSATKIEYNQVLPHSTSTEIEVEIASVNGFQKIA